MSWLSSATVYERRRMLVTLVFTLLILPVLWWSQSGSGSSTSQAAIRTDSALNDVTAGFLDGPRATVAPSSVAVASPPIEESLARTGLATYRNFGTKAIRIPRSTTSTLVPTTVLPKDVCILQFLPEGTTITVENTDNGRTVQCETRTQNLPPGVIVVIAAPLFQRLSDFIQAPIPVRITW
jgi:hypothetical protein